MSGHGSNSGSAERIIGIDLGMTSVIAAYVASEGEGPVVIPAEKGQATLASAVAFKSDGRTVVGRAAHDMVTTDPTRSITGIKRLLGRRAASRAVRDLRTRVGFEIAEGKDGEAVVVVDGVVRRIPEIAGLLLDRVRCFAEEHLGESVRRCVIAVPAYFNDVQKDAVREAATLAGLSVEKLVHEPTAIALAYGYNEGGTARVVIIDVGGIRLDVSVLEISGNVFDVVATGGDPYLGGANVDARVARWILANIEQKYGADLTHAPRLLQKVRTAAEQAKRELGRCKAVDVQIPLAAAPKDEKPPLAVLRLNVAGLEDIAREVIERIVATVKGTLEERALSIDDIDDVILVGGATRMPMLRRGIEAFFGQPARVSLPPEEVVALGAALLADSLRREPTATIELVGRSVGLALADGRFMRIIEKDSALPITRRVMIPTSRDDQSMLEVDLFEGDSDDIFETEYLGTIAYRHIEKAKAGEARVIVDLAMDRDRVLTLSSPDPGRSDESFTFETHDRSARKETQPKDPVFHVAVGAPPTE